MATAALCASSLVAPSVGTISGMAGTNASIFMRRPMTPGAGVSRRTWKVCDECQGTMRQNGPGERERNLDPTSHRRDGPPALNPTSHAATISALHTCVYKRSSAHPRPHANTYPCSAATHCPAPPPPLGTSSCRTLPFPRMWLLKPLPLPLPAHPCSAAARRPAARPAPPPARWRTSRRPRSPACRWRRWPGPRWSEPATRGRRTRAVSDSAPIAGTRTG